MNSWLLKKYAVFEVVRADASFGSSRSSSTSSSFVLNVVDYMLGIQRERIGILVDHLQAREC